MYTVDMAWYMYGRMEGGRTPLSLIDSHKTFKAKHYENQHPSYHTPIWFEVAGTSYLYI